MSRWPRRGAVMQSYHNVAELRLFRGVPAGMVPRPQTRSIRHSGRLEEASPESRDSPMRNCASEVRSCGPSRNDDRELAPAAVNLDIQIPDLLAQRIPVQPEQIGGPNLVGAGRG